MASSSQIEWTNATWNPSVGCTKVSPGCKNCYAEALHPRLGEMGQKKYSLPFTSVRPWQPHLELPLRWRQPRRIFVNSMSDLFHEDLPFDHVRAVFDVMTRAQQHTFQVLTKRSARLALVAQDLPWPGNVWMGVSVESQAFTWRIDDLVKVPATIRFLSLEPLLGPIENLSLKGINWVILGGESGSKFRKMRIEWARGVRDKCLCAGVPFFFKQWGGIRPKAGGDRLDGKCWHQFPKRPKKEAPELALSV